MDSLIYLMFIFQCFPPVLTLTLRAAKSHSGTLQYKHSFSLIFWSGRYWTKQQTLNGDTYLDNTSIPYSNSKKDILFLTNVFRQKVRCLKANI